MSDTRARVADALETSHRIDRELGGGGMSQVFLAEELALGRQVVIKVLPSELASSVNAERFQREIRTVAALQHPHIVPLITAGGSGDLLWFTMPFVEGESLRSRLANGAPLPVAEAVRLWSDMLDALAYAHQRGVIHRDIKPDNVLLSGRHALIADFGVSKALSTATGNQMMTGTGLAIGTPAYMAPEQIAADVNADHRVDIYAAGLVMYEMLVGRGPFADRTPAQQMAAHAMIAPPPLSGQRNDIGAALEQLVMQCLEKDPDKRPASAQAIVAQLQTITTPIAGTLPDGIAGKTTEKRRKRTALKVAVAVVLVAIAGGSFAVPRFISSRIPSALPDSAKTDILLLPSVHEPGDSLLARSAMETIKTELVSDARIFAVDIRDLPGMTRSLELSREQITRDSIISWIPDIGARIHLTLSIARAGDGYLISTVMKVSANDSTLLNAQDAAASGVEVPRIVARHAAASKRAALSVFGKLGRPRPDGRFFQTTPAAAQAMRDANQSYQGGDQKRTLEFLRAVTRADSTFALGWLSLADNLNDLSIRTDERLRAVAAAYRHREPLRVVDFRMEIEARYLRWVGRESEAITVLENLERRGAIPGYESGLASLYLSQGRFEDALRRYGNARDTTYRQPNGLNVSYIFTLLDLKREDDARAEYAKLEAGTNTSHPSTRAARFSLWRYNRMADSVAFYAAKELEIARNPAAQNFANVQLSNALPTLGRLREWEEITAKRTQRFSDLDAAPTAVTAQLNRALQLMIITGDTARASALIDEALTRAPLEKMAPMDRPYVAVIQALGVVGRIAEARRYSAEADREIPAEFRAAFARGLAGARVELELAGGNADAAFRETRLSESGLCRECRLVDYARAHDLKGQADSALVYYERFLDEKSSRLAFWDATFRAVALRRAGELRESKGDIAGALARYRAFVDLWRNADPALQPQVRDVEARITRLQGRIG